MSASPSSEPDYCRRALALKQELATWPPQIGDILSYNSGWPETSWEGEVKAVIDDKVTVVLQRYGSEDMLGFEVRTRYEFDTWTQFLVWGRQGVIDPTPAPLRKGPLPEEFFF